MWGFIFSIVGSLLVGLAPSGALGSVFLMLGRISEGLSGAFIMPASLALVKTYWDGAWPMQRAVSLWSMGSWGGSGFAALFGGLMAQNVGWRYICFISAVVSLIGMLMVRGTPESKAETKGYFKFDTKGVAFFMIAMVALQIVATQGSKIGWSSPLTLGLAAIAVIFGWLFIRTENSVASPFVNFKLFKNTTYTGATISNFLLNGTAGMLIVSMLLLQLGGNLTAQEAGLLTIGYAITIVLFIRVGEKLLQRYGARKPMIWGSLIVGLSIALLLPTETMLGTYKMLAIAAYAIFGLGLGFYATPSTDAALSQTCRQTRPVRGLASTRWPRRWVPPSGWPSRLAIFTALSAGDNILWLEGVITFVGRQGNVS